VQRFRGPLLELLASLGALALIHTLPRVAFGWIWDLEAIGIRCSHGGSATRSDTKMETMRGLRG